jgi:hypothetical protein
MQMAYTVKNFKTKTALKGYVLDTLAPGFKGEKVRCFQPGLGPDLSNYTGKVCLEGPHYPAAHTWYAEAELKDGIVVKVK